MFDLRNLEVSAVIDFSEVTGEHFVAPLTVHELRLEDLTTGPETLSHAIDSHLGDVLETYHVIPDTSDPEALTYIVLGPDNSTLYRAGITIRSRSLEPRVTCDQWGITDIASHLSVAPVTVRAYLSRGQMPDPDGHIAGSPWWDADRIRDWDRPNARGVRSR